MSTISAQTEIASGSETLSREVGARMRSLLEWEKAFLSEQQWAQRRNGNDSVQVHPEAPEGAGRDPQVLPSSNAITAGQEFGNALQDIARLDARGFPNKSASPGLPGCERVTVQGTALAGTRQSDPTRTLCRTPETRQHPIPRPLPSEPRGFVVTVADDVANIWLRQPGSEPSLGLSTIVKLRELLMRGGLRLAKVTVNGVLQWCGDGCPATEPGKMSSGDITQVDRKF